MNYQSLLAVTIMNHCLERSDKSDMFGQATGTTCLCRGWSFISTTLLKKQLLCAATQRIVLGAQLLQFMQLLMLFPGSNAWCLRTNSWSNTGRVGGKQQPNCTSHWWVWEHREHSRKVLVVSRYAELSQASMQLDKMSELGGKQKEENEQTDKSSLIYLVMLRYYS